MTEGVAWTPCLARVLSASVVLGTLSSTACDIPYHPEGWERAGQHGLATNLQTEDCRLCHGDALRGGIADDGCDGCHAPGWRSDCAYCHGQRQTRGAPPRDLDGQADPHLIRFPAHTAHVLGGSHPRYGCDQCHLDPVDATTGGHIFDDTPGRAEVVFTGGLSADGRYDGAGTCTDVYCHGDGNRRSGTVRDEGRALGCDACHADVEGDREAWPAMSGEHARHLGEDIACHECHAEVIGEDGRLVEPRLHVDGSVSHGFATSNIVRSDGQCSGTCHGESHSSRRW